MTPNCSLSVVLRLEENGPEVTREAVTEADLAEAVCEAWLQCCLRRGRPDVALDDFHPRLVPLPRKDRPPFCSGFALECDADGEVIGHTGRTTAHCGSCRPAGASALRCREACADRSPSSRYNPGA